MRAATIEDLERRHDGPVPAARRDAALAGGATEAAVENALAAVLALLGPLQDAAGIVRRELRGTQEPRPHHFAERTRMAERFADAADRLAAACRVAEGRSR